MELMGAFRYILTTMAASENPVFLTMYGTLLNIGTAPPKRTCHTNRRVGVSMGDMQMMLIQNQEHL